MFIKKIIGRSSTDETKKYLKYALGEILLLVAGILIALQINNWNEGRKANNELVSIYSIIKTDLSSDLEEAKELIEMYEYKSTLIDTIFNNLSGPEYVYENPEGMLVHLNYSVDKPNTKGFNLLNNFTGHHNESQDSMASDINELYNDYTDWHSIIEKLLNKNVEHSFHYLRDNFESYEDFLKGDIDKEMIKYLFTDQNVRNQILTYDLLTSSNYVPVLEEFQKNGQVLLEKIEKRLADEN